METLAATGTLKASLDAYVEVTKPKAILPHFITAAAAMFLAAGGTPALSVLALTLVGGGLVAGAANTFNSVMDRDIDALMERTRSRPLPSGRIKPNQALAFGTVTGMAGIAILSALANPVVLGLAVIALLYYVLAYTLWLKRRTYLSAVVGSAIGAIPPLIGWMAVTPSIGPTPFLLAGIVILWTLPHFWALAVFRRGDYATAGLRMLPENGIVVWITVCSSLLLAASILLMLAAGLGLVYLGTACSSGAGLIYLSLRMKRGEDSRAARRLYGYSVLYITVLFAAMIVDRLVSAT
jgi:protoheme IX farnesyltransferase